MAYTGPVVVKMSMGCDATHTHNSVASVASQLLAALDTVPAELKDSLGDYISSPIKVCCKDTTVTDGSFNSGIFP